MIESAALPFIYMYATCSHLKQGSGFLCMVSFDLASQTDSLALFSFRCLSIFTRGGHSPPLLSTILEGDSSLLLTHFAGLFRLEIRTQRMQVGS